MGAPQHAGPLLRAARTAAGLTQDAAGVGLGISQGKISDFECGRYEPDRKELEAMLDLYKVDMADRGRFLAINAASNDEAA